MASLKTARLPTFDATTSNFRCSGRLPAPLTKTLGIQNMRIVHFFPVILLAGIVSSCSDTVQVQEGFYGIKTHTGELVEVIKGPGTVVKNPFLEHVVIFARNQELVIQMHHDQKIVLSVEVLDPKKFYFLAAGRYEILASYCERKIEGLSQQEAIKLLLNKLNKPDTGIAVKLSITTPS